MKYHSSSIQWVYSTRLCPKDIINGIRNTNWKYAMVLSTMNVHSSCLKEWKWELAPHPKLNPISSKKCSVHLNQSNYLHVNKNITYFSSLIIYTFWDLYTTFKFGKFGLQSKCLVQTYIPQLHLDVIVCCVVVKILCLLLRKAASIYLKRKKQ
jgi:hypothetical protein